MKTVIITKNPTTNKVFTQMLNTDGSPKTDKNGDEYGYIRVEQRRLSLGFAYSNGGKKVRSALISMTKEAFESNAEMLTHGASADGQIVRKDALTPWYEGQKPLQAPSKTVDGEFNVITSGGNPVFRNEFFTENQNDSDEKLESYDKIEEVIAEEEKTTVLAN